MSLIIEPADLLTFKRPLTNVTKEILLVRNPNAEPVIFKVKTTAPKQYCVRPNAGRIDGLSQVEVQVILQPFKVDPPADFKCKDKFLVQSAPIEAHEFDSMPVTDIWSRIESQDQSIIRQHKIKCAFAPAPIVQETTASTSEIQATHSEDDAKPVTDIKTPPPNIHDSHINSNSVTDNDINTGTEITTAPTTAATTTTSPPTSTHASNDNINISSHTYSDITEKPRNNEPEAQKRKDSADNTETVQPNTHSLTNAEADSPPVTAVRATAPTVQDALSPLDNISTAPAKSLPAKKSESVDITATSNVPSSPATNNKEKQAANHRGDSGDLEKEKLLQELKEAQALVKTLQRELEQNKQDMEGLRLRHNAITSNNSAAATRKLPPTVQPLDAVHQHLAQLQKPHHVEGYPPQVVAIMCAVIFVFTYLFF